ncbi:MAG: CoA transferase [Proteobacteria bacterium]|nr:CoA transferase [Pseudomonadota bacterium]HQR04523.1 CoA transferase [Rhodocyclaceae bacterium]
MAGLEGLRILDLGSGFAGPFCARLLADAGAEVIKVEHPAGGDPTRREDGHIGQAGDSHTSALYTFLNQGKQGLSLDITNPSGCDIFRKLVARADVVIESFSPGTLAALELDYANLEAIRPGIIVAAITSFGQNGPYRDYQGDHLAISALGGWSWTFGESDREPLQVGFPIMYAMTGIYGAIGVLAALHGREQDGKGQFIDISAQEACLNMQSYPQVLEQFNCPPLRRDINGAMQTFYVPARDGWMALNHLSAAQWENLCALVGAFHLAEDPTLLYDMQKKRAIVPEFMAAATEWAKDKTRIEAFYEAQALQVPAGIPYSAEEVLASDQLNARGFFVQNEQPGLGKFMQPRAPFVSPSLRTEPQPAPDLGQNNAAILQDIGLDTADLRRLRSAGVI